MCRWVSIMPGITMPPDASISSVPSGTSRCGPTASIRSPTTRTSPSLWTVWVSSIVSTVPPRRTIASGARPWSASRTCVRLAVSHALSHCGPARRRTVKRCLDSARRRAPRLAEATGGRMSACCSKGSPWPTDQPDRSPGCWSPTSRGSWPGPTPRCCSPTSARRWSRSSRRPATTPGPGSRRCATAWRRTTSASTATSARSPSTSRTPATSRWPRSSPAAPTS